MSGTSITFSVQDQAAREHLDRMAIAGQTSDLMSRLGEYLQESTQRRFTTQTDPDGNAWRPLSPGYLKRKKQHADKVLTLRAYLRRSIHYQVQNASEVAWGSNVVYARIHQYGGGGTGKNGTMPKRSYLGVSPADNARALEIIGDWLSERSGQL